MNRFCVNMSLLNRREIVAGAGLLPLMAQAQMQAPAFQGKRGVAMYPWFSETHELPPPSIQYPANPYNPRRAIPTMRDFKQIKATGLDHIRLPINPGPFLAGDLLRQRQLLAPILKGIDMMLAQGLGVVVNLHPSAATHYWNVRNVMAGGKNEIFLKYLDLCAFFAKNMRHYPIDKLAFEPMNEPLFPVGSKEWEVIQLQLYATIRKEAPHHTVILSGAEGALIHGLHPFNPQGYDANTWFTFHFYEPFAFSHQGANWVGAPHKYIAGLPFPADKGSIEFAFEQTARNIIRLIPDEAGQKLAFAQSRKVIETYFAKNDGEQMIRDHLGVVERWAKRHNIAANRLNMGEFGVVKTTLEKLSSDVENRNRWCEAARKTAESFGFTWNFWNYFDVMSLVDNDLDRNLDKDLVKALGLN